MANKYTIVLPDSDVLSSVCGTNDNNLKLIEKHLGIPIYTKGNELSINTTDESLREEFKYIIDRVIDEINSKFYDASDIIYSVLNIEKDTDLKDVSIQIAGSEKKVYPRTQNQSQYIIKMRKYDIVFCYGCAGSGKTFLAVAEALRLLYSHQKSKIVICRPIIEAGENLGFLPGDLKDKIEPYLKPFYDAIESLLPKDKMKKLFDSNNIEIAPLAYMRGRTLNNCVVILDEAQNTTAEQMKMFLTRMGANAKVFVIGDITQIDLPKKEVSGLIHATNLLSHIDEIAIHRLTSEDVVRNPLVKKIVRAYENE